MNMRSFTMVFGALAAACFATASFTACIITGVGGSGVGGDGQGGESAISSSSVTMPSSTTATTSTTSTSTTSTTSSSSGGDGGMCDMNYKCAEAITPPNGDPTKLCDGTMSAMLYDALATCTCMGKCQQACTATACMGMPADAACDMCLQDTGAGCGNETQACANDF